MVSLDKMKEEVERFLASSPTIVIALYFIAKYANAQNGKSNKDTTPGGLSEHKESEGQSIN